MSEELRAPFPYFGAKSRVAAVVWQRFGDVPNYVEAFAGSLAVLLARPTAPKIETVNDLDGMVANFWRVLAADPEAVARYADWPVLENCQHARHVWLVNQREDLTARLEGDPDHYDAKIAGWWVWGISCWIGGGWCSGNGPWQSVDGKLVNVGNDGRVVYRKRVHLGDAGRGVHRQLVHLGVDGRGIHRHRKREALTEYMQRLADRLRGVRVCCGDWTRVLGPTPTTKLGLTGVFLDPPYSLADRTDGLYAKDGDIAAAVRDWAVAHGDDPMLRVALCGYDGEHDMPAGWTSFRWKALGGYGSQGEGRGRENVERECVWFSPHCLRPETEQRSLWDLLEAEEVS